MALYPSTRLKLTLDFFPFSLYPFIALKNKFIVGPGIHLLGDKMIKRLRLDYERGCFLYQDPLDGTEKECGGVMQIQIGVEHSNREVNKLPFLPIRIKTKSSKHIGPVVKNV